MAEIIDGKLIRNEVSQNSFGGTELIALRMIDTIDPELLNKVNIIHSRVRKLPNNGKPNILVLHDLPLDPESQFLKLKENLNLFSKIVCVSNWQLQMYHSYLNLPYSKSIVINNGIFPIESDIAKFNNIEKIKLIYHTTPHRGLEILIPCFVKLAEIHKDITLDVYSSFEIYGWKQRDSTYQTLFDIAKTHSQINYHGTVSNEVVREALKDTHIFAYPSIWLETSCLCLIEAMSASNIILSSNIGALPETSMGFTELYQFNEDKEQHANIFYNKLNNTISDVRNKKYNLENIKIQKQRTDYNYNWNKKIVPQWEQLIKEIL